MMRKPLFEIVALAAPGWCLSVSIGQEAKFEVNDLPVGCISLFALTELQKAITCH